MMSFLQKERPKMTAVMWVLLVFGCGMSSKAVTYYSLNPIVADHQTDRSDAPAGLVLGLGPIRLPTYLDRLQIVTRTGANRLQVDDYHRWAAPLREDLMRVLSENLMAMTGAKTVLPYPWPMEQRPEIGIEIQVHAFEGQAEGLAFLKATVLFRDFRPPPSRPIQRIFSITHKAVAGDHEALISALNQTLTEFSRQMALELEVLNGNKR